MISKTLTYIDYNGVERTETFRFNFTEAELTEMEMSTVGGLKAYYERIMAAQSTPELIKVFKGLVLDAYGEKSADGKRFIKSKELSTAFSQTPAYSQLFMTLANDDKAAAEFFNGVLPEALVKKAIETAKEKDSAEIVEVVPENTDASLLSST